MKKILCVVGARPNLMKIGPIMAEMKPSKLITPVLLHTGQHYDPNMNQVFFDQLGIPKPDIELGVGSGTLAWQVSEIIRKFDPVLEEQKPDAVLVVGDVNSTVACALTASYRKIPVVHVEAGLRSFDWGMPEEINRVTTDRLSALLFTTEPSGTENLKREGVSEEKIHELGNVMVDTLLKQRDLAQSTSTILKDQNLSAGGYGLVTLHRPSNVDHKEIFEPILKALSDINQKLPLVFAVHPRTKNRLQEFDLENYIADMKCMPPLPYLDMLQLMANATMVLTDSGGVQEETTALNVPCLTLRENTERPVTVDLGTNTLVGVAEDKIRQVAFEVLATGGKRGRCPELWDGKAAGRIVRVLEDWNS